VNEVERKREEEEVKAVLIFESFEEHIIFHTAI